MTSQASSVPSNTAIVEVFLTKLDSLDPVGSSSLSDTELHGTRTIASSRRLADFLAARIVLRRLLAANLGRPMADLKIENKPNSKPFLAAGGIEFSLSHRDGWCAVALSTHCPVGVDVEAIRPFSQMSEVVDQFFPRNARVDFAESPPWRQPETFFRWWARIEAAVKATGRGLDDSASSIERVRHESFDGVPGLALAVAAMTRWHLTINWRVKS